MELQARRSRSRTPFLQTNIEEETVIEQENHVNESVVQHSYSTRSNKSIRLNSSPGSDEVFSSPQKQKSERSVRKTRHKTSDYSSEEGENEISSSKTDLNNPTRSRLSTYTVSSTNGNAKSALQVYKEAGEYWNKFPKTDYTYSIHSKDRVELAPGVVAMPNMSRRSLRRSTERTTQSNHKETQSQYYNETLDYDSRIRHNYNTHLQPKALFKDDVDGEEKQIITRSSLMASSKIMIRRIYRSATTTAIRILTIFISMLSIVYYKNTSAALWIAQAYYKAVSKILLLDTWLLQRPTYKRRWGPLIALLFLPLILLAGWWLCSTLSQAVQMAFLPSATTTESVEISPSFSEDIPLELPKIILPPHIETEDSVNVEEIVKQILENPAFESIISKHLNTKTKSFDKQQQIVNSLKSEVVQVHQKLDNMAANMKLENAHINSKLALELNKCSRRQFVHIEGYVRKLLADLIGLPSTNEDISKWLHTIFVAKQDLETRLSALNTDLNSDFETLVENSAAKIMNDVSSKIRQHLLVSGNTERSGIVNSALSDSQVHRIVKEALAIYDADKTGMVDYALESSGGQILSTRCTESYQLSTALISILGIPLWYPSHNPRIVITPGVTPGECWSFQNFPGFLVIKLSATIKVSAFSLEHIPKSLAPNGQRDSAPKSFTVLGLEKENDRDPFELGKYQYDLDGPSLQYFAVQNEAPSFSMIELRVDSNHGHMNYTCLYRFRVHGVSSDEPT